jgi:hypothetical protein
MAKKDAHVPTVIKTLEETTCKCAVAGSFQTCVLVDMLSMEKRAQLEKLFMEGAIDALIFIVMPLEIESNMFIHSVID